MSQMNSQVRSLIIVSKQNGWDPTKIQGGPDLPATYIPREDPFTSDAKPIAGVNDPNSGSNPVGQGQDWKSPDVSRERADHTTNANPYEGKPGSR